MVALATSLLATPLFRKIGARLGLLDHPQERKLQSVVIPRTGGIGVLCGMLAGMVYVVQISGPLGIPLTREIAGILLGGVFLHIVGILDDRRGLPALVKLGAQALAVSIAMSQGVLLEGLALPGGAHLEFGVFAVPVTAFFVLGFVNAFNLVDGLDGLAGGICAIASLSLSIAGVLDGNFVLTVFSLALLGSIMGFLPFNFMFGKTFLGDAGSMLVGYLLATSALAGSRFTHDATPLILVVAASIVPILDTLTTIVRRFRNGQALFSPDSMHLHHRLIRFGLTPQRAVALILTVTAVAAGQALGTLVEGARPILVPTILAGILVFVGLRRNRPVAVNESEVNFHEIVFYLLGAQNGSGPRMDGQQGIGELLGAPAGRELARPSAEAAVAKGESAEASLEAPAPIISTGS